MTWGTNACFCVNEECSRARKCLGRKDGDGAMLNPLAPPYPGWPSPPAMPSSTFYNRPISITKEDIERIALRVVELLNENKKTEEV